MMYIKFSQLQKRLAIAFALVGMYGGISSSSQITPVQAHAVTTDASTTPTHLPLQLPSQVSATAFLNNSNDRVVLPSQHSEIQLAQDPTLPGGGRPNGRTVGGGANAQDPTLPGGGRPGRTVGGGTNVFPAPDQVAPGSRTGEASRSRGSCPRVTTPLTALIPITQTATTNGQRASTSAVNSESVYGLTVAERPTFWFYIPYSLTASRPVEFVLQDENNNDIYQAKFTESETIPGVVGFQLPPTVDPLEIGKRYHWYFLIYCNPEQPTFVEGWVERVALNPTLENQLDQATTPQQKAALYTQAGIWHEALTTLAELRLQKPADTTLNAEWLKLLQSVNLEAIAKEPVTGVISP